MARLEVYNFPFKLLFWCLSWIKILRTLFFNRKKRVTQNCPQKMKRDPPPPPCTPSSGWRPLWNNYPEQNEQNQYHRVKERGWIPHLSIGNMENFWRIWSILYFYNFVPFFISIHYHGISIFLRLLVSSFLLLHGSTWNEIPTYMCFLHHFKAWSITMAFEKYRNNVVTLWLLNYFHLILWQKYTSWLSNF